MASLNVGSLGEYLREQRRNAQLSLRQLADAAGVSNPYLSQIERGLRKPSADILQQLAKALRISAETLYVQAGILDERDPDGIQVRTAILTDASINERQKQVLLQIYESFRKENGAEGASVPGAAEEAGPAPAPDEAASPEKAPAPENTTPRRTSAKKAAAKVADAVADAVAETVAARNRVRRAIPAKGAPGSDPR
ncbi:MULTISPECIES: helix-turn-helix domain-containing protein [Streptomycetaceae]|uniref:DNA-binding protein n=1 Tax=Streptantibioticus cattleyicolor (strain ATCC 35852 / DSM 46488 / JCM 4925 / NBRC 14057 / NRRL 8057) TaxID=1003195 RepID=G8WU41_STREN|nr:MULTISPECIES: helix-turn-helix transcriptional regulator [Streptomycetaceae]AEW94865.1 DNA-binding protein [Streptantibioticus cattleyicolor NRRL 8057 = DSM 46488]MYS59481.1 helix-turn-helix domain-containing protein [Streptomyces sp. SID5468]